MAEQATNPEEKPNPVTQAAALAKKKVGSADDVLRLLGAINRIMDTLYELLEEETALLRKGKLNDALSLVEAKNQLSIQYMLLQKTISRNADIVKKLAPGDSEALLSRHKDFQSVLKKNLAVIATTREVSSELINSINAIVQMGTVTNTYGDSGSLPDKAQPKRGLTIDTES